MLGISLRKSADSSVVRVYLLSLVVLLTISVAVSVFTASVYKIPMSVTNYLDLALWIILGLGALYFYLKEKPRV